MLLGYNDLVTLDGDLFAFTTKLEWISIQSNDLQHIGYDLFSNLNDLTDDWLIDNPCIKAIAGNRREVLELNNQMPLICPPIETTTTSSTSTTPSTTEDARLKDIIVYRFFMVGRKIVRES